MAGYYDPNKDYSAAIEEAKKSGASASTIQQLQTERQNKIDDKYGGKEPTMTGSNKTYSQLVSESTTGSQREIDNSILSTPGGSISYTTATGEQGKIYNAGKSWLDGVDYTEKAWQAAADTYNKVGYIDLDEIDDILMRRQDKMDATGSNGGGLSNLELWNAILSEYDGALGPGKQSISDIYGGTTTKQPTVSYAKDNGGSYDVGIENVWGGGSGSSGGSSGGTTNSDLTEYLKEAFAQQMAAELAALKSVYEQNAADLDAQGAQIGTAYDSAKNQVAAQNDLARLSMNEFGITQGLNTGATGQMALAQNATLQGSLAGLSAEEAQAMADNALEKVKLASVYRNAAAQAEADGNSEYAKALYDEYERQEKINRQEAAAAQEQANWLAQFNAAQQADARDYAYDLVKMMLSSGIIPDDTTLAAAGMSGMDVLNQMYQQNTERVVESPVRPTGGTYDNGGLTTNQIITLQKDINKYRVADGLAPIAVDGKWGAETKAAAEGFTAEEYAREYYAANSWSGRSDR